MARARRLEHEQFEQGHDAAALGRIAQQLKPLQKQVGQAQALRRTHRELTELVELAAAENEEAVLNDIACSAEALEAGLAAAEEQLRFGDRHDERSAYIEITAGVGGLEAQDFARQLLVMYQQFSERKGFSWRVLAERWNAHGGIKKVTVEVEGAYAYGWLRREDGVHRLSRQSPFDASGHRHTSFVAVGATPIVPLSSQAVEVDTKDLRVDFYRASGPGGQNVNKRSTAVRLTHRPTGIVAACQAERSQHRNRQLALRQLTAKLQALAEAERAADVRAAAQARGAIGWGRQIRSYVPAQNRVKDLRSGVEARPQAVFGGHIEPLTEGICS